MLSILTVPFLLFTSAINYFTDLVRNIDNPTGFSNLCVPPLHDLYDFIIVGGGTTGSVIANRLSEDPETSVLLIEAGTDGTYAFDLPLGLISTLASAHDWKYRSEPEDTSCLGMHDHICTHNRGKTLGGSSAINALIFVRGNPRDFDNWEEMGNPGWGYRHILPYFKKLETVLIPEFRKDTEYRGSSGPLHVSFPNYKSTRLTTAWLQAGEELGYPITDYNARSQYGFGITQVTYNKGRRDNSAKAYLKPIKFRKNLKIILNSVVSKVLTYENTAYGVEFYRRGVRYVALARKEVILSAGAFSSPQILMLSGIGPEEELRKHNIPVVSNLPVGKAMESHIVVGGLSFTLNEPLSLLIVPHLKNVSLAKEYLLKGSVHSDVGAIGKYVKAWLDCCAAKHLWILSACPIEGLAFVNTPMNRDKDWPDIELEFATFNFIGNEGGEVIPRILNLKKEVIEVYRPIFHKHSVHVTLYVNRPRSRGYVRLRSSNPLDPPTIKRNWFTHPDDIERTIAGIRLIMEVMSTRPFREIGTKYYPAVLPGCEDYELFSDAFWECHVRTFSWTRWHETGTCGMGPNASTSVVDARLRVYGVQNLRVADASVFPKMISGNPQGACYMVGEKASDLIKEDWSIGS